MSAEKPKSADKPVLAEKHSAMADMISKLKQERDELRLKIHLGKEDFKDEWSELEDKFTALNRRFEPLKEAVGETADDVWESLKLIGGELRDGFNRIRKSL